MFAIEYVNQQFAVWVLVFVVVSARSMTSWTPCPRYQRLCEHDVYTCLRSPRLCRHVVHIVNNHKTLCPRIYQTNASKISWHCPFKLSPNKVVKFLILVNITFSTISFVRFLKATICLTFKLLLAIFSELFRICFFFSPSRISLEFCKECQEVLLFRSDLHPERRDIGCGALRGKLPGICPRDQDCRVGWTPAGRLCTRG